MIKEDIIRAIEKGQFVIASVHPQIREPKGHASTKREHLVLVVGYDFYKRVLFLHNPSGYYGISQRYAQIAFNDFEKFFAHKGIIIED